MLISILPLVPTAQAETNNTEPYGLPTGQHFCTFTKGTYWDNSSGTTLTGLQSFGSPLCVFLHPGVADSYKSGWSHTLDTLYGTQYGLGASAVLPKSPVNTAIFPGKPLTNVQTRQVFDKYLDYAILASGSDSIGDFQIDVNVGTELRAIILYVPPEFTFKSSTMSESIWTDITNDYQYITPSVRNAYDPYAPGWTRIRIGYDNGPDDFFHIQPGIYHIRLFNLRAPDVAGLYFFKIRVLTTDLKTLDIGPGNYPFVIVKNELNPAYVEVTVRTQGYTAPPYVSGIVEAAGTTPEGRAVNAVAYWGPINYDGTTTAPDCTVYGCSATYRTYLFGLAAGTYTLKAQASGFDPTTTDRITLDAGQSYTKYIIIYNSPTVSVLVWSKHGTGAIPWHNLWQLPMGTNNPTAPIDDTGPARDILLNLYDTSNALISWWGSDTFAERGIQLNAVTVGSNQLAGWHDDGATIPSHTNYKANLVDNYDPVYVFLHAEGARGYPSTHWDGHVPWTTADYIMGMPNGDYSIEAYVTGYVMDSGDAYQRSFTLGGSSYVLQFDLRRSNWIESVVHLDFAYLSTTTTVVLTAEDPAGQEAGAASFFASPANATDGQLDGLDVTHSVYKGGIIIEGWNLVFPALYAIAKDYQKDYGLSPVASTHTAGAVALGGNPYSVKIYAADMGIPWANVTGTGWFNLIDTPQASVFLCNTPVSLSFGILRAKAWISLRSTDFEVPAHSRPWTFPGSEITVNFLDASGNVVDTLSPFYYGLIQDAGINATMPPVTGTGGWGWTIPGVDYALASKWQHGWGASPFDVDNVNLPGQHEHIGVYYTGTDKTTPNDILTAEGGTPEYALFKAYRPTSLPPGEYTFQAYTHGYIMRRNFPVQIPFTGMADIEADLIQGTQIRVYLKFLHEGVPTVFNGFVRVEVFNSAGTLVGASIYGQAEPNVYDKISGGGAYLNYVDEYDFSVGSKYGNITSASQAAGFGNSTTTEDNRLGLETYQSSTYLLSNSAAQRAWLSSFFYDIPQHVYGSVTLSQIWGSATPCTAYVGTHKEYYLAPAPFGSCNSGWSEMNPSDANRQEVPMNGWTAFDVYGFYYYFGNPARTWAGGFPTTTGIDNAQYDYGLPGSVDIGGWSGSGAGLYTVKVWAFDSRGPDNTYEPPAALPSDDWHMYSMSAELKDIQAPWGGAVEYWMTMDDMAKLSGTVRWFDMYGDLRGLPWARIQASDPAQTSPAEGFPAYSTGFAAGDSSGSYLMWLPTGSHDISVDTTEAPQAWTSGAPTQNMQYTVVVQPGWVGGSETNISASGTPVPEVPAYVVPVTMIAALAASVWLLRKKETLNTPVLMK